MKNNYEEIIKLVIKIPTPTYPKHHYRFLVQSKNLKYGQGPGLYCQPTKVSLLVDKAQLPGCLTVWVSGSLVLDAGIQ